MLFVISVCICSDNKLFNMNVSKVGTFLGSIKNITRKFPPCVIKLTANSIGSELHHEAILTMLLTQ